MPKTKLQEKWALGIFSEEWDGNLRTLELALQLSGFNVITRKKCLFVAFDNLECMTDINRDFSEFFARSTAFLCHRQTLGSMIKSLEKNYDSNNIQSREQQED